MIRSLICTLYAMLLCALLTSVVCAQTSTSRITGIVTDTTGAVVPGATVTARNEATGGSQTQTTTDAGLYAFSSLPVGAYTISVERQGFKTAQKTGNILEVNTPLAVDVVLEPGQVTETVTVQGGAEQLQTTNATIGNVVEQKAIVQLPLNGRNPLNLIAFEPGVVQRSQGGVGSGVHVNGSRDRAFNVTIDGIDANESSAPNPISNIYRLTPDNVQEYRVTTNNATPEEGRNSGASVSVATRSGTNEFHGTGYYFLRNDALNASEFFANANNTPKPAIKLNQPGIEVGGPIKKNKTFFFGSFQFTKVNFATPIDQTFGVPLVYTPTARAGNFRYFIADPANPLVINGQTITRNSPLLVDSRTGQLISGVRLCTSATDKGCVQTYNIFAAANNTQNIGADSVITKLFNSFPAPNNFAVSGDGLNTAAFLWNPPTQHKGPAIMARIDHTFNQNNSVFGRYLFADYNTLKGDPLNARPVVFPGFAPLGEVFRRTSNVAFSYRRVLSARMVNELTMGYGRFFFKFSQGEANPDFPNITPLTFVDVSVPFNNTPRTVRTVTVPQVLDNLSITKGAHLIRTGFNLRFYRHVDQRGLPGGVSVTPTISFDSGTRSPNTFGFVSPTVASGTRAGINSTDLTRLLNTINALTGSPAQLSQTFLGNTNQDVFLPFQVNGIVTLQGIKTSLNQYNIYVQDEWKLRPNLTVNYGARWEINPAPTTTGTGGIVYVPSTPIVGTPGPTNPVIGQPGPVTFVRANSWFKRDNIGAIGPRLGLAWSPNYKSGFLHTLFGGNERSVIRLGYGIAFDPLSSFQVTSVAGKVPGEVTTCSAIPGGAFTSGCSSVPDLRIAQNFPQALSPPTTKPSQFLTPTLQLNNVAPSLVTFDPNLKLPTVHEWSASFQRELPHGFVFQAAYIGRRGLRLFRAYDINQISADPILPSFLIMQQNVANGCTAAGTGCPTGVTGTSPPIVSSGIVSASFVNSSTVAGQLATNAAGAFAARIENTTLAARLRPNQQFSRITYIDSGGDSYYHAAQFTLRRRFSSGLGLNLAYTYGKSIDDQSVDPVGTSSNGGIGTSTTTSRAPADIRNWREERARSDFDRTQVLTAASVWDLPVGHGQRFLRDSHGVLNQLVGGWEINTIYTFMTGEPFSVRSGVLTSNASHVSRAAVIAPVEAHLQNISGIVGPVVFANSNAFALPAPGSNGAGRNIFTAPNYWNVDFGIVKTFHITERLRLQFRTELFNAFNHPNFDNPRDASVGSPTFTSSLFGQTCCATVATNTTTNVIQTGETARVIQFGLKLQF